jgi:hypothetical protein
MYYYYLSQQNHLIKTRFLHPRTMIVLTVLYVVPETTTTIQSPLESGVYQLLLQSANK